MELITPQAHTYLHHPLFSSGEAMLDYTLGHMVYTGALAVNHASVTEGHDERHVISRLYITRHADPASLPKPEARLLELFAKDKSFSLGVLRKLVDGAFPQKQSFKTGYMQPRLLELGLLETAHQDTPEGRKAYHEVTRLVHAFEHDAEALLKKPDELATRLKELGSNVMLLHWRVIDALRHSDDVDPLVRSVLYVQRYLESGGFYFSDIRN